MNKTEQLKSALFGEAGLNSIIQNEIDKAKRLQNRINTFFSILARKQSRSKKEIRLLGDLWHFLSGSPTADQADKWDESLDLVKKGLKQQAELNANNAQERMLIHTVLDSHTESIRNLTSTATSMLMEAAKTKDGIKTTFNIVAYISSLENWRSEVETVMYETEIAYVAQRSGYLSPYTANKTLLVSKLRTIEAHEKMYKPLFGSTEAEKYYEHPLARVAMTKKAMHTVVTVPLVDFKQDISIRPISKQEKINSKYDLYSYSFIAKAKGGNGFYYFLEQNELSNCMQLLNKFVCKRRRARIFRQGELGDTVVHGSTDTTFLFKLRKPTVATLECPQQRDQKVTIGVSAAFMIPLRCALNSNDFEIPSFSMQSGREEEVTFSEITHPALILLEKTVLSNSTENSFNETEYKLNKLRVEKMSNLTQAYVADNARLKGTVDQLERTLALQTTGMACGFAISLVLTLVLTITMSICLCKYARTINSVATDLGPETKKISCCPI